MTHCSSNYTSLACFFRWEQHFSFVTFDVDWWPTCVCLEMKEESFLNSVFQHALQVDLTVIWDHVDHHWWTRRLLVIYKIINNNHNIINKNTHNTYIYSCVGWTYAFLIRISENIYIHLITIFISNIIPACQVKRKIPLKNIYFIIPLALLLLLLPNQKSSKDVGKWKAFFFPLLSKNPISSSLFTINNKNKTIPTTHTLHHHHSFLSLFSSLFHTYRDFCPRRPIIINTK